MWKYETAQTYDAPAPFAGEPHGVFRIEYFPDSDTMYLSGYTAQKPRFEGVNIKLIGAVLARG